MAGYMHDIKAIWLDACTILKQNESNVINPMHDDKIIWLATFTMLKQCDFVHGQCYRIWLATCMILT